MASWGRFVANGENFSIAFHARNDIGCFRECSHNVVKHLSAATPGAAELSFGQLDDRLFHFQFRSGFAPQVEDLIAGGGVSEFRIPGSNLDLMLLVLAIGPDVATLL